MLISKSQNCFVINFFLSHCKDLQIFFSFFSQNRENGTMPFAPSKKNSFVKWTAWAASQNATSNPGGPSTRWRARAVATTLAAMFWLPGSRLKIIAKKEEAIWSLFLHRMKTILFMEWLGAKPSRYLSQFLNTVGNYKHLWLLFENFFIF